MDEVTDKPNEPSWERPLTYPGGTIGIHEFGSYAAKVNGKVVSPARAMANSRLVQDAKQARRNKTKAGKAKTQPYETHRQMLKRLMRTEGGHQTTILEYARRAN